MNKKLYSILFFVPLIVSLLAMTVSRYNPLMDMCSLSY